MVGGGIGNVIHYIRQLAGIERAGDQTDVELLDRFVKYRDEAAFAAILNRHGPLVLSVCRNIVHESHDAEDAFQATFLVLVRKARSIRKSTALRSWLYGVAYRVAVRAKANQRKRRLHEEQGVDMEAAPTSATVDSQQVDLALHEEVYRLGEKHRLPILLCYFENKTYEEAACELGWPQGTFKKRLADARELLRCRLVRLGLTVPAGLLATGLSQGAVAAAVPATLANSTLQAALLVAAGTTTARPAPFPRKQWPYPKE